MAVKDTVTSKSREHILPAASSLSLEAYLDLEEVRRAPAPPVVTRRVIAPAGAAQQDEDNAPAYYDY